MLVLWKWKAEDRARWALTLHSQPERKTLYGTWCLWTCCHLMRKTLHKSMVRALNTHWWDAMVFRGYWPRPSGIEKNWVPWELDWTLCLPSAVMSKERTTRGWDNCVPGCNTSRINSFLTDHQFYVELHKPPNSTMVINMPFILVPFLLRMISWRGRKGNKENEICQVLLRTSFCAG